MDRLRAQSPARVAPHDAAPGGSTSAGSGAPASGAAASGRSARGPPEGPPPAEVAAAAAAAAAELPESLVAAVDSVAAACRVALSLARDSGRPAQSRAVAAALADLLAGAEAQAAGQAARQAPAPAATPRGARTVHVAAAAPSGGANDDVRPTAGARLFDVVKGASEVKRRDGEEPALDGRHSKVQDGDQGAPKRRPGGLFGVIDPLGGPRVSWDLFGGALLMYVLVVEPMTIGFFSDSMVAPSTALGVWNRCLDGFFVGDLLLNFRTGFFERGALVMEPKAVAGHYVRTWFVLDFVSIAPPLLDVASAITGGDAGGAAVGSLALVKIGRVAKVLKIARIGKLAKFLGDDSALADSVDDFISSSSSLFCAKIAGLVGSAFVVAHLLACAMAASGHGWLRDYRDLGDDDDADEWKWQSRYLAAFYWAFTTMTTVGYGDITPQGDTERVFAIVAMMVGVSFYSYIIASVASMVTAADAKSTLYFEKMDQLASWMAHYDLDAVLRRRIRRYFKQFYAERSALDENDIMHNLAPVLQEAVSVYLLHGAVIAHPFFRALPEGLLWKVMMIVRKVHVEAGQTVVARHQPSTSLYFLSEGEATAHPGTRALELRLEGSEETDRPDFENMITINGAREQRILHRRQGGDAPAPTQRTAPRAAPQSTSASALGGNRAFGVPEADVAKVATGTSFGERCLLGLGARSRVTVRTSAHCEFIMIQRDAFLEAFATLPEISAAMHAAAALFADEPLHREYARSVADDADHAKHLRARRASRDLSSRNVAGTSKRDVIGDASNDAVRNGQTNRDKLRRSVLAGSTF
ncbi:hypothetical protein M885DRAFT_611437 [Pelagophyceae sp. CCMP2097]|nr:hypothetical protein M885DRAFT_611437 [Pelagophyceae sp. CCMP2097]